MVIDVHAHTSRHKMAGLHTQQADIADLQSYAKEFGIDKIILMATYFPLKGTGLPNMELLDRIKNDPLFSIFGSLDLSADKPDFDQLMSLADDGLIHGIKIYPGYQQFYPNDLRIIDPVCSIAKIHNLPVAIHTGELHHCCPREKRDSGNGRCGHANCPLDGLAHLAHPCWIRTLASLYPKVKFIACHLSNPHFEALREVMKAYDNVFTDISGQFLSGTTEDTDQYRDLIVEEIRQFMALPDGINRIMFGTDFPIQSYRDTFDLVSRLELSPSEKAKLLGGNAERLLRITG